MFLLQAQDLLRQLKKISLKIEHFSIDLKKYYHMMIRMKSHNPHLHNLHPEYFYNMCDVTSLTSADPVKLSQKIGIDPLKQKLSSIVKLSTYRA